MRWGFGGQRASLEIRYAPLLEDGINLLPYRHVRAARLRRHRVCEFAAAAGLGLICAMAMSAWQQAHTARADARRAALEGQLQALAPKLAEHARLTQALAAFARRTHLITDLAVSRDDLFHLLHAMGDAAGRRVSLDEIRCRAGRATVTGVAADQRSLTAWVQALEQAIGLGSIEITDLQKRDVGAADRLPTDQGAGPATIGFSVQIELGEVTPAASGAVVAAASQRAPAVLAKVPLMPTSALAASARAASRPARLPRQGAASAAMPGGRR